MGYSAYAAHPRVQLPQAELGLAQNPSLGTRTGPLPLVRAADALQRDLPSCLPFLSILPVLTYSTAPRQSGLHLLSFAFIPVCPDPSHQLSRRQAASAPTLQASVSAWIVGGAG